MSERSVQADVVKKATLKYKASKLRGTTGTSVQGPKTYKEFYLVFRAVSGERKELELYSNEKRFLEGGPPKLIIDLLVVVAIHVLNGKRNEFYVEVNDGGMCLFETKSPDESTDWVSCLNAVLFAKGPNGEGILQYNVELQETSHIPYQGASILELRDGELILYRKTDFFEVVRWRLSHIRSFKAKKRLLTIFSGSRSSTGVGEFIFKSDRSVEITHAIETVVGAMAKDKKAFKQNGGGHSHLHVQNGGNGAAGSRHWSSTIISAIPDFVSPSIYEAIPDGDSNFNMEGYGKLDIPQNSNAKHGSRSPPYLDSPEHESGLRGGMRHTSPTHRPSKPSARPGTGAPSTRRVRRDYEDLDLDEDEEERQASNGIRRVVPANAPEEYSRLDREASPMRKMSPPKILPSRPHVPPSGPKEGEMSPEVPSEMYACINKPIKRSATTVHGNRPLLPITTPKPALSGSNPDLPGSVPEEYGHLVHNVPPLPPRLLQEEDYDTLDVAAPKSNGNVPRLEEYGKLDRGGGRRTAGGPSLVTNPPHVAEEYGKLELSLTGSAVPPSVNYEVLDSHQLSPAAIATAQPPQEEYGKLQHNVALSSTGGGSAAAVIPGSQPEEYGQLERSTSTKNGVPSIPPGNEYGHLDTRSRTSSFNPYSSSNSAEPSTHHKADDGSGIGTSIGPSNDSLQGPPPGYENTEIKQPSLAYKMSVQSSSQLTSKPQAPPRRQSASTSHQKKVSGYVNIEDKGPARKIKPSLPPNRPQIGTASHESSLKSGDMNTRVEFPIRRKPVMTSDYEDTGSLNFGLKSSSNATPSLQKSISTSSASQVRHPPPPAPRRGASIRNTASTANVTQGNSNPTCTNKPLIARKPLILKPKPPLH